MNFEYKNPLWLRYSQQIATMMLDKMEESHMSQKKLADLMGCSQQYVSKVLKGSENLSLETIAKIEAALDIHIMSFHNPQPLSHFHTDHNPQPHKYSYTDFSTTHKPAIAAESAAPYGSKKSRKSNTEE